MHDSFKAYVAERREGKLSDDKELFSGAFWTGRRALDLGVVDGIGDMHQVLQQRFGKNVKMPEFKVRKSWLSRRLGGASQQANVGVWADSLFCAVEERMIWDRYRL